MLTFIFVLLRGVESLLGSNSLPTTAGDLTDFYQKLKTIEFEMLVLHSNALISRKLYLNWSFD